MNTTKRSSGSILLETLVSIVLLGLIVVGSVYSYSLFQQRLLSQRQQRIILGVLQGWMEQATTELYINIRRDPNFLIGLDLQGDLENRFNNEVSDPNIIPHVEIEIDPNDHDIVKIRTWVDLNGLPIHLYTEEYKIQNRR